ncbi:unnamed protein product [Paramecium octaurelia]|uniref:Uncharacterized protein n=1 Tax=Paramecium octaurelia TaxID=43137 RepID=A0A8S1YDM7_PAROT|nr:unnamed protein product [Paramecium octaurelia]
MEINRQDIYVPLIMNVKNECVQIVNMLINKLFLKIEDNIDIQMKKNLKTILDYYQNLSQKAQENFTYIFGEIRQREFFWLNFQY